MAEAPGNKPRDEGAVMLARHLSGDRHAFAELVSAYGRPVHRFLQRTGVRPPADDDLFQETFLRVHRAAGRYDPAYPFRVWLFTIARRLAVSHHRRERLRRWLSFWRAPAGQGEADGPAALDPPDPGPDPERRLAASEATRSLERALAGLPEGPRQALLLTRVEGLSLEEAARVLEAPVPTVKTWIRRGRLALAAALPEAAPASPPPAAASDARGAEP